MSIGVVFTLKLLLCLLANYFHLHFTCRRTFVFKSNLGSYLAVICNSCDLGQVVQSLVFWFPTSSHKNHNAFLSPGICDDLKRESDTRKVVCVHYPHHH